MLELTLALIGLVLSAFFSGSEIAFIQANPVQIDVWKKQGNLKAKYTSLFLAEPERFLTTAIIGTNFANILTSSFATIALLRIGVHSVWTFVIITLTILIFGEIVPKVVFRSRSNSWAVGVTPLLRIAEKLLSPIIILVQQYSKIITGNTGEIRSQHLTREDLKILYSEIETSEEYEPDEKEVISNIIDFSSRSVKAAMTPVSDVVAIPETYSTEDAIKVLIDTGFSKLPVYQKKIDKIIGVVFLHDLFKNSKNVTDIIKTPLFIPESLPANEALEKLKRHKSSIAIVLDKIQKTAGLVTIEGLLEELFGEFEDVFDDMGKRITQISDGNLVVDSLVEIDDINRNYNFVIPKGNYETIGGFVLSRAARIPNIGETLNFSEFKVKVLRRTPNRLVRLHLYKTRV